MLIQSENTSTSFLTTCITPLCLRAAGLCSALALVASSFATEANESQTMQEVVVYSTLDLRTVDQLAASISVWTSDHAQARNAQHIDHSGEHDSGTSNAQHNAHHHAHNHIYSNAHVTTHDNGHSDGHTLVQPHTTH